MERYHDRHEAGRALAAELVHHRLGRPLVVGVAGGGIVVAAAVAAALGAPLEAVAASAFGPPGNPDLAIGAVSADGIPVLEADLAARLGLSAADLAPEAAAAAAAARRREREWRRGRGPRTAGRTVVVVDEGVAGGLRMRAVLSRMRRAGAAVVVCAVPVGPPATIDLLAEAADEIVCPCQPLRFRSVGDWYEDLPPVGDDEVGAMLGAARA